jgi:hypothetical protein
VSKYTREGKRKGSNSEHATHHQNDKYGFTQKALSSFDRRLDNLFASPLHIPSKVYVCRNLFGHDRRISTGCTRWWNDRCPSTTYRRRGYSKVNTGWGADDTFRLRQLVAERSGPGCFTWSWRDTTLTLRRS